MQIAPGVTYEVPPQLSVPTDRQNYGDILKDLTGARIDYGHILEGTGINCPFGSLGTIGNNAEHRFLRNTVGTNALGGLITITGASEIFFTPPYIVEGGFVIQGAAKTTFSLLHPSEGGTIAAFSGAAETVRWSPDEEQLLFTTKGAATTLFSLLHPGSGLIRVTPGVDQARAARPPAGGFIDISGGAVEAFIANPPEEQVLFRFTGVIGESFTPASHIGEGVLFNFNGSSELLTFAEQPEVNIRISGAAVTVRVPNHIGSGSLFALSGAAESFTANPEERQLLFSFTGTLTESFTPAPEIGSGLAKLSGTTSPEILTFAEQPFGTISVLGDAKDRFTPQHIGSGSLFALNGAAEAVGFNPPEEAPLFKFTGELTEAFIANPPEEGTEIKLSGDTTPQILTFAEQPFGTISVFGDAETPRSRPFIGSGSLRKLSGSAESITFNPEEKQMLFSFTEWNYKREAYRVLCWCGYTNQTSQRFTQRLPNLRLPTKLEWFWNSQSIWRSRYSLLSSILWFWYIQEVLWCSRISHCQSRREANALLLHRRICRKNNSISCWRGQSIRIQWWSREELHMHLLYSQISESMAKSVFVMYLITLDLVTSSTLVVLLNLSPSTQMKDNYYSPLLVR